MARKYFGTDGIRGVANKDLSIDLVTNLGLALGYYLKTIIKEERKPRVVLGTDTRISGYMIRSALSAGLTAMGVNIDFVGVIPTPGVSFLTRYKDVDLGIMISASHNPITDNGIKIFSKDGYKLEDCIEEEIEKIMENKELLYSNLAEASKLGRFSFSEEDINAYRRFLRNTTKTSFKGKKIVIDAANGASYRVAAKVFQSLGAEIIAINNIPNGKNINVNCGSTHPELLQEMVKLYKADLGLAYDGDADRLIAVDELGNIVNGDLVIAIIALNMKKRGTLNNNTVVTTVMSNLGFEKYLNDNGIRLVRANVGDRYVLEKMRQQSLNLGGEQSGHVIILDHNTTGDGVLSSIQLVSSIIESGKKLSELVSDITLWPQRLENIKVSKEFKNTWKKNSKIQDEIDLATKKLANNGRILIRESGTENLIRVMIEANDEKLIDEIMESICQLVEKESKNA
ncbi:phosphoglucosamine mutase [Oceanivirga miroungae]|uniref:Phosphoglucosamine mutase n=1 Tax=Oceanivirga miroungae TaxID=1130046 RepID=A0A6I8MDS4_9FUSO|nr:phosphoglucosamine mutase [Oceanivirga miroungae]VWL85241.1 phosphomannomutase [Oceanivirga miroungae]